MIHNVDCIDYLRQQPAGSFDCVLTDPPYSSGGLHRGDRMKKTSTKYQSSNAQDIKPEFFGDTRDQRSLEKWCTEWMRECWRVTKDGGFIFCFIDWRNLAVMIDAIQMAGYVYRGVFPWIKPNTRPQKGTFQQNTEFVVYGTRGAVIQQEKYARGFWQQMPLPTPKRIHATEKPVELLEYLLQFTPEGGRVFDPFAGSGSTGEACARLGLEFEGCELSEEYTAAANARLEAVNKQGQLAV